MLLHETMMHLHAMIKFQHNELMFLHPEVKHLSLVIMVLHPSFRVSQPKIMLYSSLPLSGQ